MRFIVHSRSGRRRSGARTQQRTRRSAGAGAALRRLPRAALAGQSFTGLTVARTDAWRIHSVDCLVSLRGEQLVGHVPKFSA